MLYIPNVTYFKRQILDVTHVSAFKFLSTVWTFDVVQEFPIATEGSREEREKKDKHSKQNCIPVQKIQF
jgi:hypothetical protein